MFRAMSLSISLNMNLELCLANEWAIATTIVEELTMLHLLQSSLKVCRGSHLSEFAEAEIEKSVHV